MYERFTDRARRVFTLAQEEAHAIGHTYYGTEHILLGLIREGEGIAGRVLTAFELNIEPLRIEVRERSEPGIPSRPGRGLPLPATPRAKRVIELALREALQLGHTYIGTEHILLGLIREGEGLGPRLITEAGVELHLVRQSVIKTLNDGQPIQRHPTEEAEATPESAPVGCGFETGEGMFRRVLVLAVSTSIDNLMLAEALFTTTPEKREQIRAILTSSD